MPYFQAERGRAENFFCLFQLPSAHNNFYAKVAYFGGGIFQTSSLGKQLRAQVEEFPEASSE